MEQIPLFRVYTAKTVLSELEKTFESGMITQGKKVDEFEEKLKELMSYPYLVSLNSATSGITLALRIIKDELNLNEEIEVLTSPLTCMATNEPIITNGMKIKWVDIDPTTCNMSLEDLERKITQTTRVLVFVHWAGLPLNLKTLEKILDRAESKYGFRIKVVEDCAHALLAEWDGKKLGTQYGHYGVYSFQAIKHLTTVDGGMLVCPSKEKMEEAKLLRWFGIDRNKRNYGGKDLRLENNVEKCGYKFHMNDVNATVGIENLKSLQENIGKHIENANYYRRELEELKGVRLLNEEVSGKSTYWIYTLCIEKRDDFIEFMKIRNVMTSCVHKRNDVHSCFLEFKTSLPNLDKLENEYVCIPVGWWITTEQREYIVKCIKDYSSSHLGF